jgi:uncharacterized repeat protein (TIGR02543 family)
LKFRRFCRRFRRSLRAVSPVIAVLLMIVIAVAAALFAYSWTMGYLDFLTVKADQGVQIQSISRDGNTLAAYAMNIGSSPVVLNNVYVNDELDPNAIIEDSDLDPGETTKITSTLYDGGTQVTVKVATAEGNTFLLKKTFTGKGEFSLTISVSGPGHVETNIPSPYAPGSSVQLTAVPDDLGWSFSSWSGDLIGTDNPVTVTMTSSMTITAAFAQDEYTLTINTDGSGTVTKNPDQGTYHYGDNVELTANPTIGWTFTGWSGDLTGTTNPDTITMNSHNTVQATFTQLVQVTLLTDDFESWNTWDQTSSNWYLSPDQHHNGRFSAKTTDGQEGDFICDPLDTTGSEAVTLDFWYRLNNGVDGTDFIVYFYDGSHWDQIVDLGNQGEDSWRHYTYTTLDSQYFKSNFRVRFDSNLGGSETIWIDDVTLYKTTSALLDDGFEGSSSSWDNNWDATSHDWYRSTTRHSGSYAAGSRNNDEGYFYSDPRDTRNSIAITVDFWYRLDDTEGSDFRLYFYDGSNYDTIEPNLGDGSEDTWRHYTYTTTDTQYFKSNFRIRFYTTIDSYENVWVDDVKIIAVKTSDALFNDGFETWEDKWDASSTSWLLGPDQHHSGSYSAKTTNGQEGNFYSDPVDTSQAISIEIDFWYRVDDLEDSDLQLYYYDGSNYDLITYLGTDPEDTWRHYNQVITDTQYFKSNFRLGFSSSPDDNGENAWIDDVTITMTYNP